MYPRYFSVSLEPQSTIKYPKWHPLLPQQSFQISDFQINQFLMEWMEALLRVMGNSLWAHTHIMVSRWAENLKCAKQRKQTNKNIPLTSSRSADISLLLRHFPGLLKSHLFYFQMLSEIIGAMAGQPHVSGAALKGSFRKRRRYISVKRLFPPPRFIQSSNNILYWFDVTGSHDHVERHALTVTVWNYSDVLM